MKDMPNILFVKQRCKRRKSFRSLRSANCSGAIACALWAMLLPYCVLASSDEADVNLIDLRRIAASYERKLKDAGFRKICVEVVNWDSLPEPRILTSISGPEVKDLAPLKGLPLRQLSLYDTHVSDLTPLEGMPLRELHIQGANLHDISVLRGTTNLEALVISDTGISDLTPLEGLPLAACSLMRTDIEDISPLASKSLVNLCLQSNNVSDISALAGVPLISLTLGEPRVSDISPLKDMPLKYLNLSGSPIPDLAPLHGMKIERLRFAPECVTNGIDVIRNMTTLREINGLPVDTFFEAFEAEGSALKLEVKEK